MIVLFYFRAARANFWSLKLPGLGFCQKSLLNNHYSLFFSNSRSLGQPGLILKTKVYLTKDLKVIRMTKMICNLKFKSWKVSTERVFLVVARKSRKETNDLCFCSNLLSGDLLVSRDCFHVCVNFNPIE